MRVQIGAPVTGGKAKKKKKHRDKKRDKDKEVQASLLVACLKRLLPVGLNLFAGREQELVQHCKDRYLKVIGWFAGRPLKHQFLFMNFVQFESDETENARE